MNKLIQIVYVSSASKKFIKDYEDNIDDIIETAKDSNLERNITGLLVYRNGVFLQLLEGAPNDVYYTLGKIAADNRHGQIKTLLKQFTDKRLFANWSMALRKLSDDDSKLIESIIPWSEVEILVQMQKTVPNEKIHKLIQHFAFN
jgi:hypothetical protein